MLNKESGFTLLESLTVLAIATIMLTVVFAVMPPTLQKQADMQFVEQFIRDLHHAQQYAITTGERVRVIFDHQNKSYAVRPLNLELKSVMTRSYNATIKIEETTLTKNLIFTSSGSANASGKIVIRTKECVYEITIYIGEGKMNVQKIE
ncbi:competence type IV pilus minor pilin ComGD [Bacillus gobiensis]|uniref:competence type IV pilus minor pilin ComGD n=1 Tax=Bacillus gobiensis TaxID=1441095 RepID=UPI003D25FBEC